MQTPFGPVINLGTLDNPSYAGAAAAIAYLRGLHTAFRTLRDQEPGFSSYEDAVAIVEALLTGASTPNSAHGRDPNPQ